MFQDEIVQHKELIKRSSNKDAEINKTWTNSDEFLGGEEVGE